MTVVDVIARKVLLTETIGCQKVPTDAVKDTKH